MCDKDIIQLFQALCRDLMAAGRTRPTADRFNELKTNAERVDCAYNLLLEFGRAPRVDKARKSDEVSLKWREAGNKLYKAGKDGEALEMYTRSVAFAEDGENLGIAFANRSAVLFRRKMYRECLDDIDLALKNHYPSRLKDKLEERQKKAHQLLDQQSKSEYHTKLPRLTSDPNSKISCCSDVVEIKSTKEMGRHIVATKEISVGEVIAIEQPFAKILLPDQVFSHCHNCLKLCYTLLPCNSCTTAFFCSNDCKNLAFATYHKFECPILATMINMGFSKLQLLALRVAICAKEEYDSIGSYSSNSADDTYACGRYKEIHQLIANTEKRSIADLFERSIVAAVIYHLIKENSEFFVDTDHHKTFQELLLLHLQTGPSNFHEISELVGPTGGPHTPTEIGAGAYAFLSLLNHACSPNVVRHCYEDKIVLRAVRPIGIEEQLFDNYGYHHAVTGKEERQEHLKKQYYFDCKCLACEEDWPLYLDLKSVGFQVDVGQIDLEKLRRGENDVALEVLEKMKIQAAELDECIPCEELANVQEIIKQCFAVMANKRSEF